MNLRTTKHRVFALILLALLAGGLACTAWGRGAPVRKSDGAAQRNVSRLRPFGMPARSPRGRSRFEMNCTAISAAIELGYIMGPTRPMKTMRLGRLQNASLSNFFLCDGTYASFDGIRTYGKEKGI